MSASAQKYLAHGLSAEQAATLAETERKIREQVICPACHSDLKNTDVIVNSVVPPQRKIECTSCSYLKYEPMAS